MTTLVAFIEKLKGAQTQEDFYKLEQEYRDDPNKPAYSSEMVKAVHSKNPELGLAMIMRLFSTDARADEENDYQHLVQKLIQLQWAEGLEYLLNQDPKLVNIAVRYSLPDDNTGKKIWYIQPLLTYIKFVCRNPEIINIVLAKQPNLSLVDSFHGRNIIHEYAFLGRTNDTLILEYVLKNAPIEALTVKDNSGATPVMIATNEDGDRNKEFMPFFQKILTERLGKEKMESIINASKKQILPPLLFSATSHEKENYLKCEFDSDLPKLSPVALIASVAGKKILRQEKGKELNTLVFPNPELLCEYIIKHDNQKNFVVNGFVMLMNPQHSVNVFCIKTNSDIKILIIDGAGDKRQNSISLPEELSKHLKQLNLPCKYLRLKTAIHNRPSGCQILTNYLAGKLSSLSVNEALNFYQDLEQKADATGGLEVADFPLKLGLLGITQSMTLINDVKTQKTAEQLEQAVNAKGEKFDQALGRGMGLQYCPAYESIINKPVNKTLERKKHHQNIHAQKIPNLNDKEMMEAMAQVMGLDVTSKDWEKDLLALQGNLGDWKKFAETKPRP